MDLFNSYKLNDVVLSNRIVMAPMTRSRADNNNALATDLMATYYAQRASAGLVITEGVFINEMAAGYINVPRIETAEQRDSWKQVANKVHEANGKIFMQIWHVGASSHPDLLGGRLPLSPSGVNPNIKVFAQDGFVDTVAPKAMSLEEIHATIKDFANAAKNAIEAGMDGVEIHAANGYLINQFFQKGTNLRTDEYGGNIENRAKILFDILDEILKYIPIQKVGIRFSPRIDDLGVQYDNETDDLYKYITRRINKEYNVAYLHFNGIISTKEKTTSDQVIDIARCMRKDFSGTLMINTGLTKEVALEILKNGYADLFSFGVPFIANPDFVHKLQGDLPLTAPRPEYFYTGGAIGYTDY